MEAASVIAGGVTSPMVSTPGPRSAATGIQVQLDLHVHVHPWRACTARVTIVVLCVCVSVCLSVCESAL